MAIITAQAVAAATPADTKQAVSQKKQAWTKFLDSLDPKKLKRKTEDMKNPLKSLIGIPGLPVVQKRNKE